MTETPSTPADRYRRLAGRFSTVVEAVPAGGGEWPSPCEGWSVADVIAHVVTTQRELLAGMPFEETGDLVGADPEQAWPELRDRVQRALDDPARAGHSYVGSFGPTTFAETIGWFYCFDLLVHGWDVARAIGRPDLEVMDPADVAWAEAVMAPLGDQVRGDGILGPEVLLDDPAASAQDRFLAWTGRRP